jgi:hypothetical protein
MQKRYIQKTKYRWANSFCQLVNIFIIVSMHKIMGGPGAGVAA